MAKTKSDKPLVRNTIIGCVIAILVFHLAWASQLIQNYSNLLFAVVDVILLAIFSWQAASAYQNADSPNKDGKRVMVIILAVILCIWAGAWAAGVNERVGL